jgi:hypothetical protein
MRSHEIELVTALAEGTLPDETEARALISSSAEARAEYEAQVKAIEALRSLGDEQLTAAESAELRREVWTGLRAVPNTPARSPWWARAAAAMGAVALAIGLFSVISGQLDERQAGSIEGTGEVTSLDDGASAPTSDAAGVTTTIAGGTAADRAVLEFFATTSEEIRERAFTGESIDPEEQGSDFADLEACVEHAGLTGQRIMGLVEGPGEEDDEETPQSFIAVVPGDTALEEDTPVTFVDPTACVIVYTQN